MGSNICDSDKHFELNIVTGALVSNMQKVSLIRGSHNSERFSFDFPRYIECQDLTQCNKVEVHFINTGTGTNKGARPIDDVRVVEGENDKITFSWLIDGKCTEYAGSLSFVIHFKIEEDGKLKYKYPTGIFKGITINDGIDNGEAIIEDYNDIITEWMAEIEANIGEVIKDAIEQVGGTSIEIVQATGDSKTAVMSQDAVTKAIQNEKDVYNVTSVDKIYESVADLPTDVGNGTNYIVANAGEQAIYSFNSSTSAWIKKHTLKPSTIYAALTGDKAGLYRYTMSAPYLVSVESHTLQEAKDYADGLFGNISDLAIDTSNLANAIKGSASGTTISIDDLSPLTSKLRVNVVGKQPPETPAMMMMRSAAPAATGDELVNLMPFVRSDGELGYKDAKADDSKTVKDVTYLVNADGSITVSGSEASASSSFDLYDSPKDCGHFVAGNYYTVFQHKVSRVCLMVSSYDERGVSTQVYNGNTAQTASFMLSSNAKGVKIYLWNSNGADFSQGVTFYPMLVEGQDVAITEYVPPQGAQGGNDTPSTPTTVTVKTCGKNRLVYPYKTNSQTNVGLTWTVNEDGSITLNGTATATGWFVLQDSNGVNTVLPSDAFLSGCPSGVGSNVRMTITNDDKESYNDTGAGAHLPKGYGYDEIYIRVGSGYTANNLTFKPMIEFGTTATEYEPYTDKGETITTEPGETVELTPILPSMVITSDSDLVILSTEYNRDTNKVIEKLTQAIIALGGNV